MGVRQVFYSDLSGKEMEGNAAKMTIAMSDKRRGVYELDITDEEAQTFVDKGRKIAGPGVRQSD